jgi:EAL domain-containing protein (putative c-di-GMP-specific phosphodiesterase class I)
VLETAIRQCAAWRRTRPALRVSVNVSSMQLKDGSLAGEILRLLEENALPADALKLEITETAELVGTSYLKTFAILRAAGVHVSIDDFGTGYANLAYLQKIHADELKIDRLFVQDLKQGTFHYALVSNIAVFAKKNGFRLCMEGVETVTELAAAELTDPDLLQGYLFDKPLTASDFEARYVTPTAPREWSFLSALRRERNHTHFAYFDAQALLTKINVGLWSVQYDKKEQKGKLYGDDVTRRMLDFNSSWLSPSRFKYFRKNICADDAERVLQSFAAMKLADEAVRLDFKWMHPTRGEIRLRCIGELISDQNDILTFEGFLKEQTD